MKKILLWIIIVLLFFGSNTTWMIIFQRQRYKLKENEFLIKTLKDGLNYTKQTEKDYKQENVEKIIIEKKVETIKQNYENPEDLKKEVKQWQKLNELLQE